MELGFWLKLAIPGSAVRHTADCDSAAELDEASDQELLSLASVNDSTYVFKGSLTTLSCSPFS